jgi:cytochrome c553
VTSGTTTLTSKLVVKGYSDADVAAGKARYETGGPEPDRVACASCHAKPDGVDHSPLKMAGFDDAVILGVIQEATYPPSTTGRAVASDYAPKGPLELPTHKWNLTDQEKAGILAHLRSLPLGGL